MTDTPTVHALAEAHREAQRRASAALVARDAAIRAAMAAGRSATVIAREAGVHRVQVYRIRDTGPELEQAVHYETWEEAVSRAITPVLVGQKGNDNVSTDYDVEKIARSVLGHDDMGYQCLVTTDEIQTVAAAHYLWPSAQDFS